MKERCFRTPILEVRRRGPHQSENTTAATPRNSCGPCRVFGPRGRVVSSDHADTDSPHHRYQLPTSKTVFRVLPFFTLDHIVSAGNVLELQSPFSPPFVGGWHLIHRTV